MPSYVPLVPPSKRGGIAYRPSASAAQPAFDAPVRWTLRVLAWLALAVASYLAWHAVNQTSVAGFAIGSNEGCDIVLTSAWSKWLGIPVAVLGLVCYAALATLSVFLGLRSAPALRWITTAFVTLSIAAAGASLWLIGIQVFAIGKFCPYCLVTDACGILLGAIATVFAVRAARTRSTLQQARVLQPGLIGLRAALPAGSRNAPLVTRSESSRLSMILAVCTAIPLVILLVGGQILFASKTYDVQKVALNEKIDMVGAKPNDTSEPSPTAKSYVAHRVPTGTDNLPAAASDPTSKNSTSNETRKNVVDGREKHAVSTGTIGAQKTPDGSQSTADSTPPAKQRLVKFLGGKLTLDVYQHPIIGSPEAPHIAIEMVSYDCPHCRKMNTTIQHALERYGEQVAVMVMVIPLEIECNKLVTDSAASHQGACDTARRAIGIATLDQQAFEKFHDFLMTGKDHPPGIEATISQAYVLADRDRLRELMGGEALKKQLESYIDLYAELQKTSGSKSFGLPVQILGDYVMTGSVENEADVFKAWEQHLGVKPK